MSWGKRLERSAESWGSLSRDSEKEAWRHADRVSQLEQEMLSRLLVAPTWYVRLFLGHAGQLFTEFLQVGDAFPFRLPLDQHGVRDLLELEGLGY